MLIAHAAKRLHDPSTINSLMIRNPRAGRPPTSVQNHALLRERRHGPRIHDLRHRFAGKTLWRWYRTGEDPERRLPILSAYLGHVHVDDTYWYLSAWPELMHEAMRRLDRRWEDRP